MFCCSFDASHKIPLNSRAFYLKKTKNKKSLLTWHPFLSSLIFLFLFCFSITSQIDIQTHTPLSLSFSLSLSVFLLFSFCFFTSPSVACLVLLGFPFLAWLKPKVSISLGFCRWFLFEYQGMTSLL